MPSGTCKLEDRGQLRGRCARRYRALIDVDSVSAARRGWLSLRPTTRSAYAQDDSAAPAVGHADCDVDGELNSLPGFGRPLLEVEVLRFKAVRIDSLLSGQEGYGFR